MGERPPELNGDPPVASEPTGREHGDRLDREAAALRQNLLRRKQQARARRRPPEDAKT